MVGLHCTGCDKRLKVKPELAGKKVKCPGCDRILQVPQTTLAQNAVRLASHPKSSQPAKVASVPVAAKPPEVLSGLDESREELLAEQAELDVLLREVESDNHRLRREVDRQQSRVEDADGDRFVEAFKEGGKMIFKGALLTSLLGPQMGVAASLPQDRATSKYDRLGEQKQEAEKAKETAAAALKLVRDHRRQLRNRRWALARVAAPAGVWVRWVNAIRPDATRDVLLAAAALACLAIGYRTLCSYGLICLALLSYLIFKFAANWLMPLDEALTDYPLLSTPRPGAWRDKPAFHWTVRAAAIAVILVVLVAFWKRFWTEPNVRRWLKENQFAAGWSHYLEIRNAPSLWR